MSSNQPYVIPDDDGYEDEEDVIEGGDEIIDMGQMEEGDEEVDDDDGVDDADSDDEDAQMDDNETG